ncbi:MAG: hypothetical protein KGL36_11800 [Gammaproteobacteria bacterium]|nr:hypothetical protein [Gammaproteobacteria bacterium]
MANETRSTKERREAALQVDAIDPERKNSPVLDDPEQSFELLREQVGDDAEGCYFNDVRYPDGTIVASGSTHLRCERGIWVALTDEVP